MEMVVEPAFRRRLSAPAEIDDIAQARNRGAIMGWHDLQRKAGDQGVAAEETEKGQQPERTQITSW